MKSEVDDDRPRRRCWRRVGRTVSDITACVVSSVCSAAANAVNHQHYIWTFSSIFMTIRAKALCTMKG